MLCSSFPLAIYFLIDIFLKVEAEDISSSGYRKHINRAVRARLQSVLKMPEEVRSCHIEASPAGRWQVRCKTLTLNNCAKEIGKDAA